MTPSHLQLDLTTAERQNLMQLSLPVSLSSLTLSGWIFSGYLILFCPTQQVCVCVCVACELCEDTEHICFGCRSVPNAKFNIWYISQSR